LLETIESKIGNGIVGMNYPAPKAGGSIVSAADLTIRKVGGSLIGRSRPPRTFDFSLGILVLTLLPNCCD
jgi:hypothetical protein